MSRKHKSRLETLRYSAPKMLSALSAVRDVLQERVQETLKEPQ